MRKDSVASWFHFVNVWMRYPAKTLLEGEEYSNWISNPQSWWTSARLQQRASPTNDCGYHPHHQSESSPRSGPVSSSSSIGPRSRESPDRTTPTPSLVQNARPARWRSAATTPQEVKGPLTLPAPGAGPLQLPHRGMSTSEQQPLLKNGCSGIAPSDIRWDSHNANTQIEIFSEHLLSGGVGNGTCNGGLSRRSEKNSDLLLQNGLVSSNSSSLSSASSTTSCSSSDGGGGTISICLPPPEKDDSRFPAEKWKAFLAFAFFQGMVIVNLTCLAVVHERVPKTSPLPDITFDLFYQADWALDASEIIIIVSIWTTLLFIFIHKHRFILLRRVFLIIGLLYLMRSVTMFVTQVPVASTTYYCSPKENSTSAALIVRRVARMMSGFGLSINGQHIYCGDYIYSGHTVILTMAYLVISEYTPRRWFLFHWATWLASATGIVFVLLSRGHYTIDVLVAYYVTTRVFWMYHTMANNQILKHPGPNNFLSRLWWFFLFSYFERNVGGVVPRQYEWPLPWPRRCLRRARIS